MTGGFTVGAGNDRRTPLAGGGTKKREKGKKESQNSGKKRASPGLAETFVEIARNGRKAERKRLEVERRNRVWEREQ